MYNYVAGLSEVFYPSKTFMHVLTGTHTYIHATCVVLAVYIVVVIGCSASVVGFKPLQVFQHMPKK